VSVPDLEKSFGNPTDARLMPPGSPVDIATDAERGFVFVLGNGTTKTSYSSLDALSNNRPPAWISIVHYDRSALDAAAPLLGLGYFNLPPQLMPTKMVLTDTHLYVAARGLHFAAIDPQYEDQTLILVYDRETRTPQSGGSQPTTH